MTGANLDIDVPTFTIEADGEWWRQACDISAEGACTGSGYWHGVPSDTGQGDNIFGIASMQATRREVCHHVFVKILTTISAGE